LERWVKFEGAMKKHHGKKAINKIINIQPIVKMVVEN
jgi:hypothetical protein